MLHRRGCFAEAPSWHRVLPDRRHGGDPYTNVLYINIKYCNYL